MKPGSVGGRCDFRWLCHQIGIPTHWGKAAAARAFDAALAKLNEHMASLPIAELDKAGFKLAKSFALKPHGRHEVRIVATFHERDEDGRIILPSLPRVRLNSRALDRLRKEAGQAEANAADEADERAWETSWENQLGREVAYD